MALSQARLNQMGRQAFRMYGSLIETVTYTSRATRSATPVVYTLSRTLWTGYREGIITANLSLSPETTRIERGDQLQRIPVQDVTWTPTTADTVTRADASVWRVMALQGGPGYAFWSLQMRKLPA